GYLGGARFSILVEADYEAQAIRVVRQMQGRDNRARVIQGSQAQQDAARITLPEDSIIHVLAFSHAVAKAYLIASYGSVQRVESAETLRHTRRGLTMDGMGSGNYSMWRCDISDAELVFGAAARERALAAKTAELQTLDAEWHSASEQHDQMHRLFSSVEKIKPSRYADVLNKLISTQRELHKTESLLAQLDLSNHVELETQLQQLKQELLQTTTKNEKLNRELGHIEERLLEISVQIEALSRKKDEIIERVNQHEIQINEIAHTWPTFDAVTRLDHADEEAKSLNAEHSRNYRNELEKNLRSLEHKLSNEIQQHNQHCRPSDAIAYVAFSGDYDAKLFVTICELQKEVDRIFNVLKNNILVEKHEQLIELKKAFNHAFVTHLCHSIYQAMNDGKRQIDLLNKELQHHRFGADRETFRFDSQWVPEFRDYARFFEELVKNPQLADEASLFDLELSRKSKKVRDELMSMLLDEDEAKAMRELQRIADYRNYHRYEIYKEVEGKEPIPLSEYGTGSGGQLETPAYIIRSAAITSAFRFSQGQCHLRMVLVDEAFSKMDETRSREVIHYLTESLGLQLMFIMPTSKCGPFMDLISNEFVFAKVPSETLRGELNTRVLVDRKQCDQAKITELWQQHRHITYQQAELDFLAELEPA
ncbi:MAG: hypothetical protein OEZ58_18860, partial [Gammaproteobacteria bacterium]|nr:hypothetical protein [Gammaproteobacteria bacterium]